MDIYNYKNEKNIFIEKTKIAYFEEGKGETIFLLHGWPQTSFMWRKVIPILAKNFKVITIDLPGLGNSTETTSYDTKNISTIIDKFREKLKIDKLHLVGHDIGSWVAAAYAINFEKHLNSLTVIDAGIPGLIPESLFTLKNANKIWQFYFHSLDAVPNFLTKGREKEYISWYFKNKSFIKDAITEEVIHKYYLSYSKQNNMENGFKYYKYFKESEKQNKELKKKISTRILAIGGEYALKDQVGIAMNKLSDNTTTKVIKDSGHYIPEEQAEVLSQEIIKWIKL